MVGLPFFLVIIHVRGHLLEEFVTVRCALEESHYALTRLCPSHLLRFFVFARFLANTGDPVFES